MKFILGGLGNWYNNYTQVKALILQADHLGIDGAVIPDHYMWGDMGGHMSRPDNNVTLESWITLAYLAATTEQIHLGTMVTPIPFRPPGMLAKMIATIDILSNGRVITGVGAGWSQVEFEGYSEWNTTKMRVDKTFEGLQLIIDLWTKDDVDFEGQFYRAKGAVLEPKPVQKPYPKLLFGSTGKRMLSLAGTYGNIIYIPPFRSTDVDEARKEVLQAAEKADRVDKVAFMAGSMMGKPVIDLTELSKEIEAAIDAGDGYYLVSFTRTDDPLATLNKFAKEIIPSFK